MPYMSNEQLEFLRYNCEWSVFKSVKNDTPYLQTDEVIDTLGFVTVYQDGRVYTGDTLWFVESTEYARMTFHEIMKRHLKTSSTKGFSDEDALRKFIERKRFGC